MSKMDPTTKFVRSLGGDYLMVREAADVLGVSQTLLRRYISVDNEEYLDLRPSKVVAFGRIHVYLYTKGDITRIQNYLEGRKQVQDFTQQLKAPGRPRLYTDEERKQRARLYTKRHYWRKELDKAKASEDEERAALAKREIKRIEKELKHK